MKKLTTEEFIQKAREVHDNIYDYSKVEYINNNTKVCIICHEHGEFWQTPGNHLSGKGCNKCHRKKQKLYKLLSNEEFIKKARQVHGEKYDYSKVEYNGYKVPICIICPEHGEFWQTSGSHINGSGCPKCAKNGVKLTTEEFIKRAKKIHGDKYDYSKVIYKNAHTKVCIICSKHGEFWQTPTAHLNGSGCPYCQNKNVTTEEFIKKSREIHGDKYNYSKVEYVKCNTKVCIICSKHGEFWQTPSKHLHGHGCPICNESNLEREIRLFLLKQKIKFEQQKRFNWLGLQSLDFYLPDYNIAIECQGIQHFSENTYFFKNKVESLKTIQKRDIRKKMLCEKHNIKLIYYSNLKIKYPYQVFEDKKELLKTIVTN